MKLGEILGWSKEDSDSPENEEASEVLSKIGDIEGLRGVVLELWLSKKARAGKVVVVMNVRGQYLEKYDEAMKNLLKFLKKEFHCGGSFKEFQIILQYAKREEIKAFLNERGIQAILCGG